MSDLRPGWRSSSRLVSRLLNLTPLVPFIPAAWQFLQLGVPDVLFTGDAATLELRTLHAAHGEQFVGPYSRFIWNHPGPAFFYLALPFYEAFGRRGPALNLFMLIANAAVAIGVVATARRIFGDLVGLVMSALLAVYIGVVNPFVATNEWNPVSPLLSLLLLAFLTVGLVLEITVALPLFVFLASAIVQTHIGFLPEVLLMVAIVAASLAWRRLPIHSPPLDAPSPRVLAATGGMLVLCWILPFYDAVRSNPNNLQQLFLFFSAPHQAEHSWRRAVATVVEQLALMPMGLLAAFRPPLRPPEWWLSLMLASGECLGVIAVFVAAWRRRDRALACLAFVTGAAIIVAVVAVRSIRGEIHPYLLFWVALLGGLACATLLVWLVSWLERRMSPRRLSRIVVPLALLWIGASLMARRPAPFQTQNPAAFRLAQEVAEYIRSHSLASPILKIASAESWPTVMGVILYLEKRGVSFFVDSDWIFMAGQPLTAEPGEHPELVFGDAAYQGAASVQQNLVHVMDADNVHVYLQEAGYLRRHRIEIPLDSVAVTGAEGEPVWAIDGIVPTEGTRWNSPLSVVLTGVDSTVTVDVPRAAVSGVYLSVDGNDLYTVRCVGGPGRSWSIGAPEVAFGSAGMRTRLFFDAALSSCRALEIAPATGDGLYAVGEVGFLR